MSSPAPRQQSLHLVERLPNGTVRFIALTEGAAVAATAGAQYALIDKESGKSPEDLRLVRKGDALVVEQNDDEVVQIDHFFQQHDVTFVPQATLEGNTLSGAAIDADAPVIDKTSSGEPIVWQNTDHHESGAAWTATDWALVGVGAAAVGIGAYAANDDDNDHHRDDDDDTTPPPPEAPVNNTVIGTIVGGPVVSGNDLRIEIFAADGVTKLADGVVNADGTFSIAVGDYFGVVIAKVLNTGAGPDYLDEATNTDKDLTANLFALETVTEPNSTVTVNLNVLTTVAYHKALEASGGAAPTAAQVNAANSAIATAFGLDSLHHTSVVTTNGGSYNSADGLSASERYGAVLAAFSGADLQNGGNSQQTIDALVAGIALTGATATLNPAAQELIVKGAERTTAETGVDLKEGVVVVVDTTAPAFSSSATATPINENSGAGQVVYTASASDAGTIVYSLKTGGDAALFSINSTTGAVTLLGNPDYETKSSYSFTVVATDPANNSSERAVTLAINNIDEVAPIITSGAVAPAINENTGAGQIVYTVTSTDDIPTGTTYSLKAVGDHALFSINGTTGAVTLIGNPDYETKSSYGFTVIATDAAGHSIEQAVSLAINDVDEIAPTISSVGTPSSSTYVAGQALSFTVNTSENVVVDTTGGTPRIALTIGSSTVYATYASGSGTSALVFSYTLQPGDLDNDGIAIGTLSANGGTLRDAAGNNLVTTLNSVGSTSGVLVDAVVPTVSSVTVPANTTYVAGETLSFTVNTSENVTVSTSGGTPQLALTIGSSTVYANYASGSGTSALVFSYTVQSGDVDADGITVGALSANGGTLRDSTGNNLTTTLNSVGSTTGVLVDAAVPTVSSVTVPANHTYVAGETLSFTVNTSENVTVSTSGGTPRLALTIGSSTVYANYASGSGSSALVFSYTVQSGDVDADGITVGTLSANGGTLHDAAGNNLATTLSGVGSTTGILVDATVPSVSSVAVPANATYIAGQALTFTVNTSENVTVDTTGGTPRIALTIGSSTVYANYVSGTGTSALVFSYTVQAGDADADGIAIGALSANGGTLRDASANDLVTTLNSVGSTTSVLVDAAAPTVSSVSVPTTDTYIAGETLSFTVNTSENVTVDTTGGTPRIALTIGSSTVYANYVSGTGTSALVFSYVLQAGETDADGITVGALDANGGTLHDAAGNTLDVTLNGVGSTTGVLVDTTAPTINSVNVPTNDTYISGETLTFTINTSENVTVDTTGGTPRLALTIGSSTVYATYASGTGTSALVFSYVLQPGDVDADGIVVGALSANGGSLTDVGGNNLDVTLNGVGSTTGILVDASVPTVSSVSVPTNDTYVAGELLTFTVNTSENVTVDTTGGTPRLALTIGVSTVYANYVSGTGTSALVFEYTVLTGQRDTDGIALGALSANGGSITDTAGNNLATTLNSVGSLSNVRVDAIAPIIEDVRAPTDDTYLVGETLEFRINTTEGIVVDTTGGTPRLVLTIGSSTAYANYSSGTGTPVLHFTYTVQPGDLDTDGVAVTALQTNGGSLTDAAGNGLNLTLNNIDDLSGVLIDAAGPTITSVDVPANDTYANIETLTFTVHLSEVVTVDTTNGVPQLQVTIGNSTVFVDYAIGTGTDTLVFEYAVQSGQEDTDGIVIDAFVFNSSTVRDADGNDLDTTLHNVASTTGVLVDGIAPTLASSTPVDDAVSIAVSDNIVLTFSEDVLAGTGDIVVSNGMGDDRTISISDATQVSISGDTVTINPTADLNAGETYNVQMASGVLTDVAGNAYAGISNNTALDFTTQGVNTAIVVFDLVEGVSSDHSSRTFDSSTAYTIYIRVNSTSHVLSTDGAGPGPADSWGMWSGAGNLDSDDRIVLVGNGSPVKGGSSNNVNNVRTTSNKVISWVSGGSVAAMLRDNGQFNRTFTNGSNVDLWNGSFSSSSFPTGSLGAINLANNYRTDMPVGILTSQGLA